MLRHKDVWKNGGIGASVTEYRSLPSDMYSSSTCKFRPEREANHIALYSSMVKNVWRIASTSNMRFHVVAFKHAQLFTLKSHCCCSPLKLLSLATAMFDIGTVTDMTGEE